MTDGRTHWEGCWKEHQVCAWAEVERLRGLLREARKYLTPATADDHGCADGECPECDMLRLGLRIDAELGAQP